MPKIRCTCNRLLAYREEQAGKTVKCPLCSAKIHLPMMSPEKAKGPLHGIMEPLPGLNQRLQAAASPPPKPGAVKLGQPVTVKPVGDGSGILVTTTPAAPAPAAAGANAVPQDTLKLDAANDDIPLAGDVPTWESSAPQK